MNHKSGYSTLLTVIMIALILSLLLFPLILISFLQTKQSNRSLATQQAFFAAEGAMFETIQHLKNDLTWPQQIGTYQDTYTIGPTKIFRTITLSNPIQIEINTLNKGVQRRLAAEYQRDIGSATPAVPLDIALILDVSSSMKRSDTPCPNSYDPLLSPCTPIDYARNAAANFVQAIQNTGISHHIALISFNNQSRLEHQLSTNYDEIIADIRHLDANGGTNISAGLKEGIDELEFSGELTRPNVIVIFSDGAPQYATNNSQYTSRHANNPDQWDSYKDDISICLANDCPRIVSGNTMEPLDQGTYCTHEAISQSLAVKDQDYTVFSVFLASAPESACQNVSQTERLGELTLFRISSETSTTYNQNQDYTYFKRTSSASELEDIFEEIGTTLSDPGFVTYQELVPESLP